MNNIAERSPLFQVNVPGMEVSGADIGMCIPGAVAGTCIFGVAGFSCGAINSIYSGAAIGAAKAAGGATTFMAMAERSITHCATDAIYSGGACAMTGFKEGAIAGTTIGFFSIHYPRLTGQSFPDVKLDLSLMPKIQIIERV
ncbi:hypothetical protein [Endozoicomonas sp. ONNA2]|uniref:hypothetical protein n=1 Tax=Endozoicomonas sp. ONNA2 TaxID=2828741 RepID=UPI002148767F|nr:hypothetical protein [Endozoicomonas sp. ONNA2]